VFIDSQSHMYVIGLKLSLIHSVSEDMVLLVHEFNMYYF